jgi:alkanesulfonate monooxygenase SsuD/methylene tetrahydromethanopterin reductase-like flavin-dependent oxidoreductase (luciferase family)
MNAGGSERGRHFVAKYCDLAFIPPKTRDFGELKQLVSSYRDLARDEYDNKVEV